MDLKTVKFLLNTTFMIIIAALVIGSVMNNQLLIYMMIAFFVIYGVIYLGFWRCPKCKKHLGKLFVHKCKNCGHDLGI